jgi:threonine dehydrogenase-like Zn-dependent dehydrogenase
MKAVRYTRTGGPEVLEQVDVETPVPGAGQVRVRVAASAFNAADAGMRGGFLPIPVALPHVPGYDVSGTVDELGEGVVELAVGDEVVGFLPMEQDGGAAEFVVAPAEALVAAPTSIPLADAAALPSVALTAWQALVDDASLEAGQRLLVVDERLPRGQGDGGQGCCVGQRDARRSCHESYGGGDDELGRASVELHGQEADDPVADAEAGDVVAERVDRARDVVAGHVGQHDRDGQEPAAHAGVGRAVGRGRDTDPHLPGTGGGRGDLAVLEDLGPADLVELDCLHGDLPRQLLRFRSTCEHRNTASNWKQQVGSRP